MPRIKELEAIADKTGQMPQALLDEPKLSTELLYISRAFSLLSSRRSSGFSINPISLESIAAYLNLFESYIFPNDIFVHFICVMDNAYLNKAANKQKHGRTGNNSSRR